MEKVRHIIEFDGPKNLRLHMRNSKEIVQFSMELESAYGVQTYLDAGAPGSLQLAEYVDEELEETNRAISMMCLLTLNGSFGAGDKLQYMLVGPKDVVEKIIGEVSSKLSTMVKEWDEGKFDTFQKDRDDWAM